MNKNVKPHIICNKIKTPDGTVLQSFHRHDYKEYKDKVSNEVYMADGGLEYLRRTVNKVPYEDLSIYSDAPHSDIREHFYWGTYGKFGNKPFKRVLLKEMSEEHINSILRESFDSLPKYVRSIFNTELSFRKENKIHIKD